MIVNDQGYYIKVKRKVKDDIDMISIPILVMNVLELSFFATFLCEYNVFKDTRVSQFEVVQKWIVDIVGHIRNNNG